MPIIATKFNKNAIPVPTLEVRLCLASLYNIELKMRFLIMKLIEDGEDSNEEDESAMAEVHKAKIY
jgi:hypothetical protein